MNKDITGNELQLYKSFYVNYPDAILVLQDGVIIECNELGHAFFQIDDEQELLDKKISDFLAPKKIEQTDLEHHFTKCLLEGKDTFEWVFQNKKEKVTVTIFLSRVEVGAKTFIQVILRDITEYKKIEQGLKKSIEEVETENTVFKLVVDNLPQGIFWKDLDCAYLGVNKLLTQIGGFKDTREVVGKSDFDMPWTDEESIAYQKDDKDVMQNDKAKLNIVEAQTNINGEKTWLKTSKIPLKDKKGEVFGLVGIFEDITDQKIMEQKNDFLVKELKEQNRKTTAITEVLDKSAIISMADKKGIIIKVNEEFCQVSKYSEEELLGKTHSIVNSEYHDKEFWKSMWRDISKGKTWRADVKNKAKDGSFYWVDTVINSIVDSEGKIEGYLSIRYLITKRKQQEIDLQIKHEQLATTEEELRQNLEELEAQRDYIQDVNEEIKLKSAALEKNSQALLKLNKNPDIYTGNLDTAFEIITQKIAKILDIERVSIWKYDTTSEAKVICQKKYEKTEENQTFTKGMEIEQKDVPIYFEKIIAEKNIIAEVSQNNPALVEFIDNYLKPLKIKSVLNIPYYLDGGFAGVISCETQAKYKKWTQEDVSFVKGISDAITLVIKTKQQLEEQEKVKQSEKLLFQFLEKIPIGISIIDSNKMMFYSNEILKNIFPNGMNPKDGANTTNYKLNITGTDTPYPKEKFPSSSVFKGITTSRDDIEVVRSDKRIPLEISASPVYSDTGEIIYAIATVHDITERRAKELEIKAKNNELIASEEELRQNLEELEATQESMREKQTLIEETKRILEKQNTKLISNEEILKKAFNKMKLQEKQLLESFNAVQAQEEELRQNLEELETTQEALLQTQLEQEKLVSVIKNVDALVAIIDMESNLDFLNPKGEEMLSSVNQGYKGKNIEKYHDEKGAKYAQEVIIPAVLQKGFWKGEHKLQNPITKELYETLGNFFVIKDPNTQEPIALACVQIDITEQKQLEKSIQEQNERLQASEEELRQNLEELETTQEALLKTQLEQEKLVSVIKNVDALIAITDMEGNTEFLNDRGRVLSGFNDNYLGRNISAFHNEEGAKIAQEVIIPIVMQKGFWKGEHQLQNYITKELFQTLGNVFVIKNPLTQEPVGLASVQLDITEQKQLEKSIQEQNERLQASEEELRQNMEELEATQEAMREKQTLIEDAKLNLEKKNEKLASNEAVLKKALQKMRKQDVQLRENLGALQTQEEELRQNMEELQTTQEVMAYQKNILEVSNRQITKSISYAETIQKAILPSKTLIKEVLPNSFVIYKPKDIVSGDFYWLSKHENKTLIGVIDCTGHGVPGAFMSLVGSNILSEIINQRGILQPNLIFQELHNGVVKKLNQKEGANNDGMDLTFCLIEEKSNGENLLTFAGVKQNLYIVRDKELIELKGNRRSIGGGKRDGERNYTQEEITLQKNDAVFLATDGYSDQANEERKSFSKKKFRELMIEVGHLSPKEQMKILEQRLTQHQKNTEQRDDITVFGFKIQN